METNIPGWPTVWYATSALTQLMTVAWSTASFGYTALQTDIAPPEVIKIGASYALAEGQTLQVSAANGTGSVVNKGTVDCMTIANLTTTQFSCGAAWTASTGPATPGCALQLFGGNNVLVRPLDTVLLVFESATRAVGQSVQALSAPGLLVSCADVVSRSVDYSINTNWAANTEPWATQYPAGTDLSDVLISPVLASLIYPPEAPVSRPARA